MSKNALQILTNPHKPLVRSVNINHLYLCKQNSKSVQSLPLCFVSDSGNEVVQIHLLMLSSPSGFSVSRKHDQYQVEGSSMAQLCQINWDLEFHGNLYWDYESSVVLKDWDEKLRKRLSISAQLWKFCSQSRGDSPKFRCVAFTFTQTPKNQNSPFREFSSPKVTG